MRPELSPPTAEGCTIGAKVLNRGEEFVLFKNKDLRKETFDDLLLVESGRFGVLGVHIPPKGFEHQEEMSGFSIGVNDRGVAACNSHVRSLPDGCNYDLLTEAAVTGVSTVAEACDKVRRLAPLEPYNWCNIIVADPFEVAVLEVAGDVVCERGLSCVARANTHLLPHGGGRPAPPCPRGARAVAAVAAAEAVPAVFDLLRSHEGESSGPNICRHGEARTLYSYVLHWRRQGLDLWVRQGNPCQGDYAHIPLRFPLTAAAFRGYPSARRP